MTLHSPYVPPIMIVVGCGDVMLCQININGNNNSFTTNNMFMITTNTCNIFTSKKEQQQIKYVTTSQLL
jgi:hypothetical protein